MLSFNARYTHLLNGGVYRLHNIIPNAPKGTKNIMLKRVDRDGLILSLTEGEFRNFREV